MEAGLEFFAVSNGAPLKYGKGYSGLKAVQSCAGRADQ